MNSKEDLKKIADGKNYKNTDSIINEILEDAKLEAEQGSYSMYIDSYFKYYNYDLKHKIIKMLKSEPYNFEVEKFSDITRGDTFYILKW